MIVLELKVGYNYSGYSTKSVKFFTIDGSVEKEAESFIANFYPEFLRANKDYKECEMIGFILTKVVQSESFVRRFGNMQVILKRGGNHWVTIDCDETFDLGKIKKIEKDLQQFFKHLNLRLQEPVPLKESWSEVSHILH